MLALSVQGAANATIPRERVIESYRMFIAAHKSVAGFVAQDLAAWNYWDAGPEYVALMRSELVQHPASRYAMLNYLRQSPRADAKMVRRYAHLSAGHLAPYAERLCATRAVAVESDGTITAQR